MAPRPDPLVREEIGRSLNRVRRLLLKEAGLRLLQRGEPLLTFQVLNHLGRCGPGTQSELAAGTGQHPTGMSRLLDELENAELVRRTRDPQDRRKIRVAVTAAGRARLRKGGPAVQDAIEAVLAPLGAKDRRLLRDLLRRLLPD